MFQSGGLSQWAGGAHGASGSMNASIILDQPGNVAYTNLDEISGRVVVRSGKSENVNSIVVKLEGESRTRLLSPPGQNGERPKPMIEYHKVRFPRWGDLPRGGQILMVQRYSTELQSCFRHRVLRNNDCQRQVERPRMVSPLGNMSSHSSSKSVPARCSF